MQHDMNGSRQFDVLIDMLPIPAAVISASGDVHYLNSLWATLAPFATTSFLQLISDQDRFLAKSELEKVPAATEGHTFHARLPNGHWHQIAFKLLEQAGEPLWMAVATDIDDVISSNNDLSFSNRIHAQMLNTSQDCIKLIDPQGRLLFMNEAGCAALNIASEDVSGTVWSSLLPENVRSQADNALEQVLAGETARFTGRSELPDGGVMIWDNLITPYRENDGDVTNILCISRNMSKAHQIESQLRESQERLALAARVGNLGIWDLNLGSGKLYCDEIWHSIMGLDAQKSVTHISEFTAIMHPEDAEQQSLITYTAHQLVQAGEHYTRTYRVIRPDGVQIWIRSIAFLIQDLTGKAVRAVGFVTDVTAGSEQNA